MPILQKLAESGALSVVKTDGCGWPSCSITKPVSVVTFNTCVNNIDERYLDLRIDHVVMTKSSRCRRVSPREFAEGRAATPRPSIDASILDCHVMT